MARVRKSYMRGTPEERFWAKVDKTDGCWLWTATRIPRGYGMFGVARGKTVLAHRFAWAAANGPIPKGLCVLHRCDNPPCVRPDHLFLGTQSENMQDALVKGRWMSPARVDYYANRIPHRQSAHGERSSNSKLTADQVSEIRRRYTGRGGETLVGLASQFGVTFATISHIVNRRTWKHVA